VSGFRLAALLRVRKLQEDAAAGRAGAAAATARTAEGAVERRRTALASSALPEQADERIWRAQVAGRAALSASLTNSRALADERARDAGQAQAEWAGARRAVRPLERLLERHREVEAAEELRAEQLLLDEHATRAGKTEVQR